MWSASTKLYMYEDGGYLYMTTLYNVCSVHRGIPWVHRGIPWVHRGIPWVHRGILWVHRGILWVHRGIPWVHQRDIMMHVGEQGDRSLSIYIENPDVMNIPRTHGVPPMYSWYPPMYSWYPPMYSWYPTDVLNTPDIMYSWYPPMYSWYPPMYSWYPPMYSWYPPMYSWYPPMYSWYSPDVLMIFPRCTEHPPMYWTHIIQGDDRKPKKTKFWRLLIRPLEQAN